MRKIILASASPRRRELLTQAGIRFEVVVSDAREVITKSDPSQIVEELAYTKAKAVAGLMREQAAVIGADTVVAVEGEILGKPGSEQEAFAMLSKLQGRTHQVFTGVAVIVKDTDKEEVHIFSEKTDVTMYPMEQGEIRDYIATGEPMDKAGAYGIQGRAAVFVKQIQGDYNNVVGLPIARLYQEMKQWLNDQGERA